MERRRKKIKFPLEMKDGRKVRELDELKESFAKGYIFYDNFTVFKDRKVKFSEKLPNKQMSHQGMIKIVKEEYDLLLGN